MKRTHICICIILGIFILAPVANAGVFYLCDNSHPFDIGADSASDCCNSSFNESDHCKETHINTHIFLLSNNIRPTRQLIIAKLLINIDPFLFTHDNSSNIHPNKFFIHLPNELSCKSTIVLQI